eukprot:1670355-Rhodomonas_salina.5
MSGIELGRPVHMSGTELGRLVQFSQFLRRASTDAPPLSSAPSRRSAAIFGGAAPTYASTVTVSGGTPALLRSIQYRRVEGCSRSGTDVVYGAGTVLRWSMVLAHAALSLDTLAATASSAQVPSYAMSGTAIAYQPRACYPMPASGTAIVYQPRACYGMSGTDIAWQLKNLRASPRGFRSPLKMLVAASYGPTPPLRAVRY